MIDETMDKLRDPKVGDTYTEQFSIYMYVLDVSEFGIISVLRRNRTECSELIYSHYPTVEDFINKNTYSTDKNKSYWTYVKNKLPSFLTEFNYSEDKQSRIVKPKYDFTLTVNNENIDYDSEKYLLSYNLSGLKVISLKP